MNAARVAAVALSIAWAAPARAARPTYEPLGAARTFARPGGPVLVHYAIEGVDAVLPADLDGSGVPDFVEEVADRAAESLAAYAALGFRPPISDDDLEDDGGDGRLDIYLQEFGVADGHFASEGCTEVPHRCSGHVRMENDFVGYPYATTSLGIRVLVSHELFHAVQAAYDADQPASWAEGTAVWAEEWIYPEQDDFERLVAGFLAKTFRPFERAGGGFGDPYPYGAGLWAHFLALRFGDDVLVDAWEGCEETAGSDPGFLDVLDGVLAARGSSLAEAWIEFTRWNGATGAAAGAAGYPDAGRLALAFREPALTAPGAATVSIDGMSARYLPISGGPRPLRIVVEGDAIAAEVRAPGAVVQRIGADGVASRHELVIAGGPADVEVIVSGARRGGLPRSVTVTASEAPVTMPEPPPPDDDDSGCSAAHSGDAGMVSLTLIVIAAWCGRAGRRAYSVVRD